MGLCASVEDGSPEERERRKQEKIRNKHVQAYLQNNMETEVSKLLLLGAGGSGKSTFFKQMKTHAGMNFTDRERTDLKSVIYGNIMGSMRELIKQSDHPTWGTEISGDLKPLAVSIGDRENENAVVDKAMAANILKLWADPGIQKTYQNRSRYQLYESTAYFLETENLERIAADDYLPNNDDIMRMRVITTGCVQVSFEMDDNKFQMMDVGGQRSERKKWIHCFENVTGVLFVAAISSYDQVLFEDCGTNRLDEALTLFEEISNSEWFVRTSIILFLNKTDLFKEKLKTVPLKDWTNYDGEDEWEPASQFMLKLFTSRCHEDKDLFTHFTCATDTSQVVKLFKDVRDIVIKIGLSYAGLM